MYKLRLLGALTLVMGGTLLAIGMSPAGATKPTCWPAPSAPTVERYYSPKPCVTPSTSYTPSATPSTTPPTTAPPTTPPATTSQPTPEPTLPGTSPIGVGAGLPVTGAKLPTILITGAVLLAIGVGLVFLTRRREEDDDQESPVPAS